jgi:hypothetical protein
MVSGQAEHMPGPPLPESVTHELLTEIGWMIGQESDSIIRWHRNLRTALVDPESEWNDSWDAILAILNHSAVLSRVFWPASKKARVRGAFLRQLFEVPDDSALNENGRALRNTIEHWDERLDDAEWATVDGKYHGGLIIGSFGRRPDSYFLRAYDPEADLVVCGRSRMPILPLVGEAQRINYRYAQVVGFLVRGDPIWYYPDP